MYHIQWACSIYGSLANDGRRLETIIVDGYDYALYNGLLKASIERVEEAISEIDNAAPPEGPANTLLALSSALGMLRHLRIHLIETHRPATEDLPF